MSCRVSASCSFRCQGISAYTSVNMADTGGWGTLLARSRDSMICFGCVCVCVLGEGGKRQAKRRNVQHHTTLGVLYTHTHIGSKLSVNHSANTQLQPEYEDAEDDKAGVCAACSCPS